MDAALAAMARVSGKKILDCALGVRPHIYGEWRGRLAFDLDGDGYHVRQSADEPLRLFVPDLGFEYSFRGGFDSDGGSIPKILQDIPRLRLKPDSFLRSYFLHDYCYAVAVCWCRRPDAHVWSSFPLTRAMADCLLYVGLTAEGATLAEARAIYRAVRIGGSVAWRKHRRVDGSA